MGILKELRDATLDALESYKTEVNAKNKPIPNKHQLAINQLNELLTESETKKEKRNALLLRQNIESFLESMDVPWISRTLPVIFGDDLYEKINHVLNKSEYRESTLIAKEAVEAQIEREKLAEQQTKILGYLENSDVSKLIKKIEDLENQLEISEMTCNNLKEECEQLHQENLNLMSENQRLLKENTQLKIEKPIVFQKNQKKLAPDAENFKHQSADRDMESSIPIRKVF